MPKWSNEPVDWRFCVRGKNPDGKTVALGHHKTEEAAAVHYKELPKDGYYADLRIDRLSPPDASPTPAR